MGQPNLAKDHICPRKRNPIFNINNHYYIIYKLLIPIINISYKSCRCRNTDYWVYNIIGDYSIEKGALHLINKKVPACCVHYIPPLNNKYITKILKIQKA